MSIFKITVQRPVAISMVVLGVVVFGAIAYKQLPLNLMPTMSYPRLTIRTEYPGSGPEEVERQISRPIESILGTVGHLVRIVSHSRAELSELVIEFDWKVNMDIAVQEVREKIDLLRLPEDAERPVLLRYDPNLDPMMRLGLWGKADLYQLRLYAEEVVRPALETLPGVAAVKIKGGLEREVEVALDEKKISALGVSIDLISKRLKEENINLAGGRLKEGATHYLVRTLNEFVSLEDMGNLIIVERDGKQIRLRDVARLRFHPKEQEIITRVNGRLSVELSVFREADANIVEVSRLVRNKIFGSAAQRRFVMQMGASKQTKKASWKKRRGRRKKGRRSRKTRGKKGRKSKKSKKSKKGRGKWKGRKGGWSARRKRRMKRRQRLLMTRFLMYNLPDGMKLKVLEDQAIFIRDAINEVLQSAFIGGIVAVLVLLLFMRNLWSTVIIGLSIPLSVVATFAGLYMSGVSLNIMSLGGLALGIGMLVDNSIVVLESILRFREEGESIPDSAVLGVAEVGGAVTASTLTTVAVFFPIVFVQGAAGQLLRDLALTVVLSLLSSLIVSLFFIPMLSALQLFGAGGETTSKRSVVWRHLAWGRLRDGWAWLVAGWSRGGWRRLALIVFFVPVLAYLLATFVLQLTLECVSWLWKWLVVLLAAILLVIYTGIRLVAMLLWKPVVWVMDIFLHGLEWGYPRLLAGSLKRSGVVLVLAVLMAGGAYLLLGQLKREFVPKVHQGAFQLELAFPVGTPLQTTAKRLQPIESWLSKLQGITSLTSTVGVEKTEVQNAEKGEHSATVSIKLLPYGNLERKEKEAIDRMRGVLENIPGLRLKVEYPALFSMKTPIEVEVRGEDLKILGRLAQQVKEEMEKIPSLRDIRSSAVGGLPEIQILYKRERLLRYGISVQQVAQIVRNKVHGAVATKFRKRERRLDVLVRVNRPQLQSMRELLDLTIHTAEGVPIPLRQVAKIKIDEGPSQILRVGSQRAIILRADLDGMALGEATAAINEKLAQITFPPGYSAGLSGQSEEMERSLQSLLYALLLSIFLVYLVMASQFESLVSPFVILFSIPLAFIGVVGFFWWFQLPVSVMVLIGLIILAGIVVNNAIVLVDAMNKQIERGVEPEEAIRQASALRLRPILMTTATTVLGLLPLALGLGEGSELRRPMAIAIMVGLLFSTLLTLVVIPILYKIVIVRVHTMLSSAQPELVGDVTSSGD